MPSLSIWPSAGSTNAIVHLTAIAGRLGIKLELNEFDLISRRTPWIVNVKPSGDCLMEDFFQARRRTCGDA